MRMAWPGWRRWGLFESLLRQQQQITWTLWTSNSHPQSETRLYLLSRVVVGIHSVRFVDCREPQGGEDYVGVRMESLLRLWGPCFPGQGEWKGSRLFPNVKLHPTLFLLCAQIWLITISLRLPIIHPLLNRAVHFIWQGEFFKNLVYFHSPSPWLRKVLFLFLFLFFSSLLPWVCRRC